MDPCGLAGDEAGYKAHLAGVLREIGGYATENRLPPEFVRLTFGMGVAAYLSLKSGTHGRLLPMPFRLADGSPNEGDEALGVDRLKDASAGA